MDEQVETYANAEFGTIRALADAAMGATLRGLGQGGLTAWQRTGIDLDISPLVACTLALHGAFTSKRHPGRRQAVGGHKTEAACPTSGEPDRGTLAMIISPRH